jgi:hypothetical protein
MVEGFGELEKRGKEGGAMAVGKCLPVPSTLGDMMC